MASEQPKPLSAEEIAGFQEVAEGISTFQDNDYVAEGIQRLLATLAERDREIRELRAQLKASMNIAARFDMDDQDKAKRIKELEGLLREAADWFDSFQAGTVLLETDLRYRIREEVRGE